MSDGETHCDSGVEGAAVAGGSAVVGAGVGVAAAPAIAQGVLGLIGFGSQGIVAGMSTISCVLYFYSGGAYLS